jgi:para-aminobenzoate synthetase component 1
MVEKLNTLTKTNTPFIVLSNFEGEHVEVYTLKEAKKQGIAFSFNKQTNITPHNLTLTKYPLGFEEYKKKFDQVIKQIEKGNTYLLNLTQPTPVQTDASLLEIFQKVNAPYKILYKNHFVCFSPETFIRITNNTISTYPMKGTIDASITNAKEKILANPKEKAEHVMVVDLLRNDLGIVADSIHVEEFRYIDTIQTRDKTLLQVSSKITGILPNNWKENFGTLLLSLLPAGSISGTPKKSTVKIIKEIEGYKRGYFSGIFGYFDGENFDSCVLIRFLEQGDDGNYTYKSGGGITIDSDALAEYNELLDKVYLP